MAETGLQVTARRRFGQFLIMSPATVEIDGAAAGEARWGKPAVFPTPPGPHRLTVSFPYLGKKRVGAANLDVTVGPDQVVAVLYRSPWIIFNAGSITPA